LPLAVVGASRVLPASGLIAFGPARDEYARLAARYIDRILKGAKPGELSIEQPTRFHLLINLKSAKALGLTIPAKPAIARGREDWSDESFRVSAAVATRRIAHQIGRNLSDFLFHCATATILQARGRVAAKGRRIVIKAVSCVDSVACRYALWRSITVRLADFILRDVPVGELLRE
jgi:hypothetical protein